MSRKNTFQAIQSRKPSCSSLDCSSYRTRSSTWTQASTSTSLLSQSWFTEDDADHLDPLDDISLDIDLDQRTASSATLLSRRVSSLSTIRIDASSESPSLARLSESSSSRFLYPLYEPGQRIAQRTQRLRARTAAVIMSIPATCEDVIDVDEDEPNKAIKVAPVTHSSKLRRVAGIRDLRRAFRDADHAPTPLASVPSLDASKASYELGILVTPAPPLSSLTPRSSLRTLVDAENAPFHNPGDAKTLYDSTLSSISITSRFAARLYSTFSPSRIPQPRLPTASSQSIKYPVHTLSITRTRRHTSLHLDACSSHSPGENVWSCAKISQSVAKRAARRIHTPRRVFSNPISP